MIAIKYATFAVVSTVSNLTFQYLSLLVYRGPASLYVAMAFGTLTGLVTKYVLDKRYIFSFQPKNRIEDANRFFYYSLTGVITTAVFWATEIAFDAASDSEFAKYIGAVVGLSIGFVSKYHLDKKFVFKERTT